MGGIEYGFLAIGGFFVIVGIIFYVFKTPIIKTPVSNALIKKALK
jgi:predicted membrane channel-forming protein YqfA (hemolysin III family)